MLIRAICDTIKQFPRPCTWICGHNKSIVHVQGVYLQGHIQTLTFI